MRKGRRRERRIRAAGHEGFVVAALALASTTLASDDAAAQATPVGFRGGGPAPGVVDTRGLDRLGGIAWTFDTEGPVRGSPTVADGTVYVPSGDGHLYALDAATGALEWSYDAGAPAGGAPLVLDDRVLVTTRGNALHAVSRTTGRRLWAVDTGADLPLEWGHEGWDYLLPSPVLAGQTVLVGSGDGHLYALDPADGSEQWRFRTGGRIRGSAALADGAAWFGSGDGFVYGVDPARGREMWRFRTAGVDMDARDYGFDRTQIQATPVLRDGMLYVGSRDASLYAVDVATRAARWTLEDGTAWVVASPVVAEGRVWSARSSGGAVRAIDAATGEEIWSHRTGGLVFSSPLLVDGGLYVGSGDGRVYAFDAETGAIRWTFSTGGMVLASPAVHDGLLYVGSDDGTVYALKAADGPAPRRAVFWDDAMTDRAFFGGDPDHRRFARHFEERGFEALDTAGLRSFLEARVADRVPSVVVFGMDAVPGSVADPEAPASSLLRRYLEAGGKVVWPGFAPLVVVRDSTGRVTGIDRARPAALLGVDHAAFDTDRYGSTITPAGERWGLETTFVASPGVHADAPSTVLALDETGRASAWVRSYGGAEGTGFVLVPPTLDPRRLAEVQRVAEHGVFRAIRPQDP